MALRWRKMSRSWAKNLLRRLSTQVGISARGGDQSDLTYYLLKSCCLSEASGVAKKTLR